MLHNLIKSPCRLHVVILEVAEVFAEVGERVLDAKVFSWRIYSAPCSFQIVSYE